MGNTVVPRTGYVDRNAALDGAAVNAVKSYPARGTWIEIFPLAKLTRALESYPARGTWIEISRDRLVSDPLRSRTPHGVRG